MLARDFTLLYSFSVLKVPSIQELSWEKISLLCLSFSCAKNTVVSYQTKYVCNGGVLYLLFCRSRTRPKTFLQCFALEQRESKAKHCRGVLGRKNKVQNRSLKLSVEFLFLWKSSRC